MFQYKMRVTLFYSSEEPEFGARDSFIKNLLFHKNKCENHHKSNQIKKINIQNL
ncbi:hypothetical protein LMANV2_240045 [Leptospira interrogans serovar Manilae]|uniref:Uncharacterized protein n=1 Tax=Leptospira interrogans serovar Manilae TaxID=214675 RepID=A0AAQ1NZC4_LEPIR|nr:hypothetical protein LMANV2_240045 [Leptospira interrogans serovar Manilae]